MAPIIAGGLATATRLAADPNADASSINGLRVNAALTTDSRSLEVAGDSSPPSHVLRSAPSSSPAPPSYVADRMVNIHDDR